MTTTWASERIRRIKERYYNAIARMDGPWCNYGKVTMPAGETTEFYNVAPYGSVWDQEKGVFCADDQVADMITHAPQDMEYMIQLVDKSTMLTEESMRRMQEMYEFVDERLKAQEKYSREGRVGDTATGELRKIIAFMKAMIEDGEVVTDE